MNLLKDITIGQYVPKNSIVHRIDPRVKIALTIIFMTELFLNKSWIGFALLTLFLGVVTILSQIPFMYVMRGLKPIVLLVFITLIFNTFFSQGTLLWQKSFHFIWDFTIRVTREGLNTGLLMAVRLILLVFSTSLLTLTTSPIQLTDALESLLNPFRVIGIPSHELAMMMSIALRFIPVLIEETEKIFKAQRSRGATFGKGNIIQKAKSLLPILVPLFVHAFKHAEDLASAMEARCYRGGIGRTRLKEIKATPIDIVASVLTGAILILVVWCDVYVHI